MVQKRPRNSIETKELRSKILSLFETTGTSTPLYVLPHLTAELNRLGITHVHYGGVFHPVTPEYLERRIYKVKYYLESKDPDSVPLKVKDTPPEHTFVNDIDIRRQRSEAVSVKKRYESLLEEYEKLKKLLDVRDDSSRPMQDFRIPVKGSQKDQSVAVVLASDWHYEERITSESVNMLNNFDLSIADARIKNFFGNTVKLLNKEQKDSHIKTMILALLGDFITGNIHEDNVESSQLGVGEALWAIKSRIHSGIKFILDNTDVNLVIPCHSGNHGRHTKKQRIANEKNNSLEWLIYKSLSEVWESNSRVKFLVGDSYHSFVEPFPGYLVRFHHGHFVKYGGGVGGITIPINKAISMWNRNRAAQLDCMGHFHQYCDGGNFVVNGSLIGYSPYAVSIKGAYERPSQSFFLINGKYLEKTCSSKIFLEEK
jgi:hypothetical protein